MEINDQRRTLRSALPLLLAATCSTDAEELSLDHRVKASYLYNLLRFIDWPHDICSSDGLLNLSIYGADSLDAFYGLHGERVGNRLISVERIRDLDAPRINNSHILVISGDRAVPSIPIVRGLLTVSETDGFIARGGILNLLLIGGRVRFEINEETANVCGFAIDPRLSKLRPPAYLAHVA